MGLLRCGVPHGPVTPVQGYLAHKKLPSNYDHRRALGMVLLQGPKGGLFLMSEAPLQSSLEVEDTHRPRGVRLGSSPILAPPV